LSGRGKRERLKKKRGGTEQGEKKESTGSHLSKESRTPSTPQTINLRKMTVLEGEERILEKGEREEKGGRGG